VIVRPELTDKAMGLNPIHTRESLGRKSMIFENVDRSYLAPLGELHVPSVADLFVAKLQRKPR
jgi:ABC-2 type transport system ATP-binding protein